jgi:hypothetical protein
MGFPAVNEPTYARRTAAATPLGNQASTLVFERREAFAGDGRPSESADAENIF